MSNKPDGTLYVGVTNNLSRRAWEHREGAIDGFTKKYGLKRLVYYECYDNLWTPPAQGDLLTSAGVECTNLSGLLRDCSRPWP